MPFWWPNQQCQSISGKYDYPPVLFLSILTAIFPGEPGLATFTEAKDDGSGGD